MDKIKIDVDLIKRAAEKDYKASTGEAFMIATDRWEAMCVQFNTIASDALSRRAYSNQLELISAIMEIAQNPQEAGACGWMARQISMDVDHHFFPTERRLEHIEIPPGMDPGQFINEFLKGTVAVKRDPREIN